MPYRIAGIDVHKRMLAIAVCDVAAEEYVFDRLKMAATPDQLRRLAEWLDEQQVDEVVMESTAQYWKPVWQALEQHWQMKRQARVGESGRLHLAQAQSNRARRGRKTDFADAERLIKRLVADELALSFVPDPDQRLWRSLTRRRLQLTRARVRLQNQLEALLEEAHLKLSSVVSDLLGCSARRMLQALAQGEADAVALAALADGRLRATPQQLEDALGACSQLHPVRRRILKMMLEELEMLEQHMLRLDQEVAALLKPNQDAIERLASVPGLGVDSAQQIIAEIGPTAAAFASAKNLASWIGICPGKQESAEVVHSSRCPKGNRNLRRLFNQAAHAAVKTKGSLFQVLFTKYLKRMPYQEAITIMAHRLSRLVWKILHQGATYQEHGPAVTTLSTQRRAARMIRQLSALGYRVEPPTPLPQT